MIPVEVRPDVDTSLAANLAGEPWLSRSDSRTSSGHLSALIVVQWLINRSGTANAGGAHFCEGDLLLAVEGGHALMIPRI